MIERPRKENVQYIPAEPRHPSTWGPHPRKKMVMTPIVVALGGLLAYFTVVLMVVVLPTTTFEPPSSPNNLPLTPLEEQGRRLYLSNGCIYCHSGFVRPQDYAVGQYYLYPRIAEPGDYVAPGESPNLFGTERTGPDLSESGGFHPDDWHIAHYKNPRSVTPVSLMPSFEFLTTSEASALIAFTQSRLGKLAQIRAQHQLNMKQLILAEQNLSGNLQADYQVGYPGADNLANLMMMDRGYWFETNPLPVTEENLLRGREIYKEHCVGCHGVKGDGAGAAVNYLNPPPAAFNQLGDATYGSDTSPGAYYWRILRGVPGTAMENFGTRLSVEDIWRVVLFLKTIPNGGLEKTPTPDLYVNWVGYPGLFAWAECFYHESLSLTNPEVMYTDNTPPGVGDVAAMVAPGQVNPEYAVILYEVENQQIPCSAATTAINAAQGITATTGISVTQGITSTTSISPTQAISATSTASALQIITDAANRPTEGYARMGISQLQFIPPALIPSNQYGEGWLQSVWNKPMPTQ